MLSMKEYSNLQVRTVLNIRKISEDAIARNPDMSSGAVVDLIMEGMQDDVFDGWDPDADKA
jgi:hypothetical protein